MLVKVLDYFVPPQCIFCNGKGNNFCRDCQRKGLIGISIHECHVCKNVLLSGYVHKECQFNTNLDGVIVCVRYNHCAMKLVEELKYNLYFSIATEIGYIMKLTLKKSQLDYDALVPVPLHWYKENFRGFNQAELLAKHIDRKVDNCLKRKKRTQTQVNLNRQERIENLKNMFQLKRPINYNAVVLVDDIMTTGTTLEECASVLKRGGVEKVYGLAFARG
jgi:competence protein ComFC